jgi:tRNA (guanine37-N1)-methyltransferase
MTLVCGRYEGFDERAYAYGDDTVALGDFVMTAGDPAALCIIDTVVRLLPDVVGNPASLLDESFTRGGLEYPQYTRPVSYQGDTVPEVLRGGNHRAIEAWRQTQAQALTAHHRPDLAAKGRAKGF